MIAQIEKQHRDVLSALSNAEEVQRRAVPACNNIAIFRVNIPNDPVTTNERFFQSTEGYKDDAANYADGGVVNAADTVLSSPLDIAHALLRDKKIGMGMPTAQVDRSLIVQDRAKMPAGYRFDFSMNEAHKIRNANSVRFAKIYRAS